MDYQIGDLVIGTVVTVKPYALFMEFEGGTKGLLHISELSDSYIRDIDKYGSIGDEIKVKVLSIDTKNGFLRVSYKQVPDNEKFTSHKETNHVAIDQSTADFSKIEESLPIWIKNTLEKMKEEKK